MAVKSRRWNRGM